MVIGPSLIWMIIETPFLYSNPNFLLAKALSITAMMLLIPIIFYIYHWILKKELLILGILDFVFSAVIGQWISYSILKYNAVSPLANYLAILNLILIVYMYLRFTINPPKIFLFLQYSTKAFNSGIASSLQSKIISI